MKITQRQLLILIEALKESRNTQYPNGLTREYKNEVYLEILDQQDNKVMFEVDAEKNK